MSGSNILQKSNILSNEYRTLNTKKELQRKE